MTKKQLNQLVINSYSRNYLDKKRVAKIADCLSRKELKKYIKGLKAKESKTSIIISIPYPPKEKYKKMIKNLFPHKKIIYNIDPELICGIKVTNNDKVFEMDLNNSLKNIISYIEEYYDRQPENY